VFHFRAPRDEDRRFTHYRAFATSARAPADGRDSQQEVWTQQLPVLARAMVKAGDRLYLAGPPDPLSADDPHAALAGQAGGRLVTLSAADGAVQGEHKLPSPPVFDGVAAAAGRLYLSAMDGSVVCLGGAK
jgi:hypothetical protein